MADSSLAINLRTSGLKGTKTKGGFKLPEELHIHDCDDLDIPGFVELTAAKSFEQQIQGIRKVFHHLISHPLKGNPALQRVIKDLVRLFFEMSSKSSVRKVIASCFNKFESEEDIGIVIDAFENYLKSSSTCHHFAHVVLRCFETCNPAKSAAINASQVIGLSVLDDLSQNSHKQDVEKLNANVRTILCLLQNNCDTRGNVIDVLLPVVLNSKAPLDTRANASTCITVFQLKKNPSFIYMIKDALLKESNEIPWLEHLKKDDLALLCTCQAILVVSQGLSDSKLVREILLVELTIISQLTKRLHDPPAVLQHSRIMFQWISRLDVFLSSASDPSWNIIGFEEVEQYIWSFISSSQDNVRHNIRNILAVFVRLLKEHDKENYKLFLEKLLKMSWSVKEKYLGIQSVIKSSSNGCQDLVDLEPSLPTKILFELSDNTISSHCYNLYEACMMSDREIQSEEKWMQRWVQPLLKRQDHLVEKKNLLRKAMECSEVICNQVLHDSGSVLSDDAITNALIAIRIQKLQRKTKSEYNHSRLLQLALNHYKDSIRNEALDCIVATKSSAECFEPSEFELVKNILRENLLIEPAEDRQNFLAIWKKFLSRLQESLSSSLRRPKQDGNYKELAHEFIRKTKQLLFEDGLSWKDANFFRRTTALSCLKLIVEFFPDHDPFLTKDECRILIETFEDSFEQNKEVALFLLQRYSTRELDLDNATSVLPMWKECLEQCESVSPNLTSTASFRIVFLIQTDGFKALSDGEDVVVFALKTILERLKENISQNSIQKPVFGCLQSIRKVIKSFVVSQNAIRYLRDSWIGDILQACKLIHSVTSQLLTCGSPEGMSFAQDAEATLANPQGELLAAWRSCKEVSLLFAQLVRLRTKDDSFQGETILSNEDIKFIVDFFVEVLSTCVHRGAFEQAFVGFTDVCFYLWNSKTEGHMEMVRQLVRDTLDQVSEREFCPTRRSAGIPFLLQALLVSETTSLRAKTDSNLVKAMETLFQSTYSRSSSLRVQSCNILRAVFRNTSLKDDVISYAGRGFEIAIRGFKSSSWAERNSATLLFSALITRVFGVKRDKNEFSQKNLTTFRAFFQRFPDLFKLLTKELKEAARSLSANPNVLQPCETALYPVLIILAKLRPSPSSTKSDEFQFKDAILTSLLEVCQRSCILQIRKVDLSSKVIARLTSDQQLKNFFGNSDPGRAISRISSGLSTNQIHGILLMKKHMMEYQRPCANTDHLGLSDLLLGNRCALIKVLALETTRIFFECRESPQGEQEIQFRKKELVEVVERALKETSCEPQKDPGFRAYVQKSAELLIIFSPETTKKAVAVLQRDNNEDLDVGVMKALLTISKSVLMQEDAASFENLLSALREKLVSRTREMLSADYALLALRTLTWLLSDSMSIEQNPVLLHLLFDDVMSLAEKSTFMDVRSAAVETLSAILEKTWVERQQKEEKEQLPEGGLGKMLGSRLVSLMYSWIASSEDDTELDGLRKGCAECLVKNWRLFVSVDDSSCMMAFQSWKLFLTFGLDSLMAIRHLAFDLFVKLTSEREEAGFPAGFRSGNVTPRKLGPAIANLCLWTLHAKTIALAILMSETVSSHGNDVLAGKSVNKVFEKCEINSWREDDFFAFEVTKVIQKWRQDHEKEYAASIRAEINSDILKLQSGCLSNFKTVKEWIEFTGARALL